MTAGMAPHQKTVWESLGGLLCLHACRNDEMLLQSSQQHHDEIGKSLSQCALMEAAIIVGS
jgi:hypothetical protein